MQRKNEEYYIDITGSFALFFQNQISEMKMKALNISFDTRKNLSSALLLSSIKKDPYYYKECVDELAKYRMQDPNLYNIGIFYYGEDYIFTHLTKYNFSGFCELYMNIDRSDVSAINKIKDFFSYDNNTYDDNSFDSNSLLRICSTYDNSSGKKALLVGTRVRIGNQNDEALIFYILDSSSINVSLFASQSASSMEFCVFDSNNKLLYSTISDSSAYIDNSILNDKKFIDFLTNSRDNTLQYFTENKKFTVFKISSNINNYKYISFIPMDLYEENLYNFYSTLRIISFSAFALLILLFVFAVYINYKPIIRLVRGLSRQSGENELQVIENTLARMRNETSEQNMLIMDFLLSNLLYGIPIPDKELERLEISKYKGPFCVLAIPNLKLNTTDREQLSANIYMKYGIVVYITDILYNDHTIIICLLKDASVHELSNFIKDYIYDLFNIKFQVYVGEVVDSINNIRKSYIKCLNKMDISASEHALTNLPLTFNDNITEEDSKSYKYKTLMQNVIEYINDSFTNPSLSQTKVADHFGISTYSLSRLFKEHIGIGFTEYITAKRIDYAKRLLLTTDKTVAEIGCEVGIPNANYFSKLFKANCGVSPTKFRSLQL
ncbi:MAG TPA: helix-turn-helix domain-containing protein [Clostridiaceae bacterium]|nr:helix-turn-helix domain-containing protein [Clostridiaceae bacterium]